MKVIIVPLLKKLMACLVSFIPLREISEWLWNASSWTLLAIGTPLIAILGWLFFKYLSNDPRIFFKRIRSGKFIQTRRRVRSKMFRGIYWLTDWLAAIATLESREAAANISRTRLASTGRIRSRNSAVEPDAGPCYSFRQRPGQRSDCRVRR